MYKLSALVLTVISVVLGSFSVSAVAFFFVVPARLLLDSADSLHSLSDSNIDTIHLGLASIASGLAVGWLSELLYHRLTQSTNRRTQRIIFTLVALVSSVYWQYSIFK